ncbi:MAG: hypothetical protein RI996_305 [Candidatus Parcubacteria bacterium]|jgi:hypothetical protein
MKNTISHIQIAQTSGPFHTKSDADLSVKIRLDTQKLSRDFFVYSESCRDDIKGLRLYVLDNLQKDKVGGYEFHKERQEIVSVGRGSVRWVFEDTQGAVREYIQTASESVHIPPFILHTYTVLEDDTQLLVLANTLFVPEDKTTHDTYGLEEFKQLMQ